MAKIVSVFSIFGLNLADPAIYSSQISNHASPSNVDWGFGGVAKIKFAVIPAVYHLEHINAFCK